MARSDLLLSLIRSNAVGDKKGFQSAAEAIIAEERAKQHNVLADRIASALGTNGNGGTATFLSGLSANRSQDFLIELVPRKNLDDLFLKDSCRIACEEIIEEQRRADLLRAHSLEPRNRILLVGPPGNGKTSLAEAIAESLSVPFFVVRYETIIGSFLGETAGRLKRVFDYARTTPCVLFFDEFDAVGKERGDLHETGEIKRVVTSLLLQVDALPAYTVVIAATNHSELLDRAVWRRFQLRIRLMAPSRSEVIRYLEKFQQDFGKPVGLSAALMAEKIGRVSYAEVEDFCLNIRRRFVLSMGEIPLKKIVEEQISQWSMRVNGPYQKESINARIPTSSTADS